jgi:hypothetical protein
METCRCDRSIISLSVGTPLCWDAFMLRRLSVETPFCWDAFLLRRLSVETPFFWDDFLLRRLAVETPFCWDIFLLRRLSVETPFCWDTFPCSPTDTYPCSSQSYPGNECTKFLRNFCKFLPYHRASDRHYSPLHGQLHEKLQFRLLEIFRWNKFVFCLGVELRLRHQDEDVGWGCVRMGCWARYMTRT